MYAYGSTGHQHKRSLFQSTTNNMSLSKCWVLRTTCLWLCSDPVSNQPFPYALATCTLLCPANCIQERITHKERSTSHFTLEEVGWFSDMAASRLPEYSSLVVSTVNGKVTGNVGSIFCHSVICLGTDQCFWDGNHMPG